MCKVSDGENAFAKIGEALDNLNIRGTGFGSSILGMRRIPPDSGQANSSCQDNSTSGRFDPATTNVSGPRLPNGRDSETKFPSELISSCVATILMIQVNKPEILHILQALCAGVLMGILPLNASELHGEAVSSCRSGAHSRFGGLAPTTVQLAECPGLQGDRDVHGYHQEPNASADTHS
jgi:hypothetical protein